MSKRVGISALTTAALVLTTSSAFAEDRKTLFDLVDKTFGIQTCKNVLVDQLAHGGAGCVDNAKPKPPATKDRSSGRATQNGTGSAAPRVDNAALERNRDVQRALNHFGFNAGGADGKLGPKSRTAIEGYQAYMGDAADGTLSEDQRRALVDAYTRDLAGEGERYADVVENEGTKGLLKAFDDPEYADRYRQPVPERRADATDALPDIRPPQIDESKGGGSAFPPLPKPVAQTSMATHCELIAGMQTVNGGAATPGNIGDPDQALGEQFCEARSYAITQSQSLLNHAAVSEPQLVEACAKIAGELTPVTSRVARDDARHVQVTAKRIVMDLFNNDIDKAMDYGELCLGIGYRHDDPQIALAAAILLMAGGEAPYAEVLGHHLRWGFGQRVAASASRGWYDAGLTAMAEGAPPVFLPSKTAQRNAIIQAALDAAPVERAADAGRGLDLPMIQTRND